MASNGVHVGAQGDHGQESRQDSCARAVYEKLSPECEVAGRCYPVSPATTDTQPRDLMQTLPGVQVRRYRPRLAFPAALH